MLQRLKRMLVKEFLQMLRDPRMRVVVFGMPLIQLTVMAFALNTDVTDIRTAVLDMDRTPTSREMIEAFAGGGYFRIDTYLTRPQEVRQLMDRGEVMAVIHLPAGFERDLLSGRTAKVQIITDGTDSNTTAIVLSYSEGIVQSFSHRKLQEREARLQGGNAPIVLVETAERAWFNTNQESKYYYVPALIAVMLFIFSLLLTSIGIVKEKEIGTIEQVMVTPIRRLEFILGKTIPYMVTGYVSMTLMLAVAMLVFDIRVAGSWGLLYGLTGIYLCGNLGLALLVSASAATQQQALLTTFLILMPCVMLSGFMFPVKNMPMVVQYMTFLNPMRWYLEILRGVVMKGIGIKALWPAVVGQAALAVTFIFLAAASFRKTIA